MYPIMVLYTIKETIDMNIHELKRIANNIWIEYVYGYITANKAIELLDILWQKL